MPFVPMQTNFTAGVWSPRLHGRVDIQQYKNALAEGLNGVILPHGGFKMRGGTKYLGEVKDSSKKVRMIPFIYSRTASYILEFGDGYLRFWDSDGSQIQSGGSPLELQTPYAEADLPALQKKQSFDVSYFTHPNHPVHKLIRYAEDDWAFEPVDWFDGPYLKENIDGKQKISASSTSGSILLTATQEEVTNTTGSWSGTTSGTIVPFSGSNRFARFRFTAPTGFINLKQIRLEVTSVDTSTVLSLYGRIYNSSGGNPTTLKNQATNIQYAGGTGSGQVGNKTWYFSGVTLTAGTTYIFEVESDAASTVCAFRAVADFANVYSDYSATATAAFSALGTDYRCLITYTATGNATLFQPGHVGSLWRLRHSGVTQTKAIGAANVWTTAVEMYGKFNVDVTNHPSKPWIGKITLQKSFDGGTTWYDVGSYFASTNLDYVETRTGVYYRLGCNTGDFTAGTVIVTITQDERWGIVKITEYIDAHQVRATTIYPLGATSATPMWAEGAWNYYRGFPASITCHEDRFYYAGTYYQPTNIWASWVGDYECFMPSDSPESALNINFTKLDNPIQWIDSFTDFLMGTLGEEALVKGSQNKPISSDNIDSKIQGSIGSCHGMRPLRVDSSLIFLQLQRKEIRELSYSLDQDGYGNPRDLTAWAEHLTEAGVVTMAYAKDPDQTLLAVCEDGTVACLTYYKDEKVVAWTQWTTDGEIEDAAVIPSGLGDSAGEDRIWLVVKRTINSQTKRFLEMLQPNNAVESNADYFCVDCGITYDSTATTTITGLSHLEGETVSILADGVAHATRVVSSGQITLAAAASKVHVGLSYASRLVPLRPEIGTQEGTAQGRIKRIVETTFRFLNTISHDGLKYSDWRMDRYYPIEIPDADQGRGDSMIDVHVPWPMGHDEEGQICVEQTSPCPMTLGALIYKMEIANA